ncbi:DegT/DnrJ/EryC1/StrS family aminotransferase [bacterium]|nr:DegT/DnrJ/EryC1/StrS family aminotransferase [bacterium]
MKRIPVATPVFSEAEADAVYAVMRSGWVTMGPKVAEFEQAFAVFTGAKHAIAMFNGTATLHAALAALGIGPGDEVVVPTLTYISTSNVVLYQGAELRLCECDPLTYNVRVKDLERVVTPRTKAIITVDMNGMPVDYDSIVKFAADRGISVIGDSAESLGAHYRGQPVGTQAPIHSFSFFGNKNITTGEGGMITTDDDSLAAEMRILRNQGQTGRYNHTHLGFNYRMTELQAAVGIVQLKSLHARLEEKRRVVAGYTHHFADSSLLSLPVVPDYVSQHGWYMYAPAFSAKVDRDAVVKTLDEAGIETRVSFPPVHIQPYYVERFGYKPDDFPMSLEAWSHLINLPISPNLTTEEIDYVASVTLQAAEKHKR